MRGWKEAGELLTCPRELPDITPDVQICLRSTLTPEAECDNAHTLFFLRHQAGKWCQGDNFYLKDSNYQKPASFMYLPAPMSTDANKWNINENGNEKISKISMLYSSLKALADCRTKEKAKKVKRND